MNDHGSILNRSIRLLLRLAMIAAFLVAGAGIARAQEGTPAAAPGVDSAVRWLVSQQAKDGGFLGFSGESDSGATTDAMLALVAAKNVGVAVDYGKALQYLRKNALVYAQTGPGQSAKLVLTMVAAGADPTDVEGVNPLSIVQTSAKSEAGLIGFGYFDHALGILALVATKNEVPVKCIDILRKAQIKDGSWAFDGTNSEAAGDTNTTAIVIQALVADGLATDPMVEKALGYLKSTQADSGGFPYQAGDGAKPDANSTALVIQAIIAAGQDPSSANWTNATGALAAFQNPSGAFRYTDDTPDDNLFATVQAIPAMAGEVYPILSRSGTTDGTDIATPKAA